MSLEVDNIMVDRVIDEGILDFLASHWLTETKEFCKLIIDKIFGSSEGCRVLKSWISVHHDGWWLVLIVGLTCKGRQGCHTWRQSDLALNRARSLILF